ncbi:MAG TPA: hypothetical protein VF008_12895 [Niastella sp.]
MIYDSFNQPTLDHLQGFLYSLACIRNQLFPQEDVNYQYYFLELFNHNNSNPKEVLIQLITEHIQDIDEKDRQYIYINSNLNEITSDWRTTIEDSIKTYFSPVDALNDCYSCRKFFEILIEFLEIKTDLNVFEWKLDMNKPPYNFYYQWGMDFKAYLFILNDKMYFLHFATALG